MLVCRVSTDHLPYYSNSLKQSDVQEADGGGVIVHQVEKVDPALEVYKTIIISSYYYSF